MDKISLIVKALESHVITSVEAEETPQTKCIKYLEYLVEKYKKGETPEYTIGPITLKFESIRTFKMTKACYHESFQLYHFVFHVDRVLRIHYH